MECDRCKLPWQLVKMTGWTCRTSAGLTEQEGQVGEPSCRAAKLELAPPEPWQALTPCREHRSGRPDSVVITRASDFFSARSSLLSGDNSIHSAVKTAWHDVCEGSLWATEWLTVTGSIYHEFSYTFNRWLYWLLITEGSGKLLFCWRTSFLSSSMPLKIQKTKCQPSGTIIICDFRSHNSVLQWIPCVNCFLYGYLPYPDLECKLSATSFSSVFTTLFFTGAVGLEWGYLIFSVLILLFKVLIP